MSMFGMGGYGFEAGDSNLHDKIAKLKARRGAQSSKQRVEEFLEKELHVDPRDLPFDKANANARLKEIAAEIGGNIIDLHGNSLGLKEVAFSTNEPHSIMLVRDDRVEDVDWHDLNRCWDAYVKHVKVDRENDEPLTVYSFHAVSSYYDVNIEPVVPTDPEPDPSKYPSGTTLRIQKATFNAGDLDVEQQYVRVGGLWSDDDIVNIETMQPINDVSGWTVVEQL